MPVYTDLPVARGERRLAEHLISIADERLHLFFNLSTSKGSEADLVIVDEATGAFVIEVKDVSLRMIRGFGAQEILITGREDRRSPVEQAKSGMHGIMQTLGELELPFIVSTAWFPSIARDSFAQAFSDGSHRLGQVIQGLLFEDEAGDDLATLRAALSRIRRLPPAQNPPKNEDDRNLLLGLVDRLVDQYRVVAPKHECGSDRRKRSNLELRVRQEMAAEIAARLPIRRVSRGAPGTGKTVRLLEAATRLGMKKQSVLFLCYNKVLAADIQRIQFSGGGQSLFEAFDLFEKLQQYAAIYSIPDVEPERSNDWAIEVVSRLADDPNVEKFDAVVIDEGQDMMPWVGDFIRAITRPDSSILIAVGEGQELYHHPAEWIGELLGPGHEAESLKKNFRNRENLFVLAQCAYETKLDEDRLANFFKKRTKRNPLQLDLDFELPGGPSPLIGTYAARQPNDNPIADAIARESQAVGEVRDHIEQALEQMLDEMPDSCRMDLLILVPSANTTIYPIVQTALAQLGVAYLDLVSRPNRRNLARPHEVRLCTFHSSRGIEGNTVLIYGFEDIARHLHSEVSPANLAYIVLSRATHKMKIFLDAHRPTPAAQFIRAAIEAHRESKR